MKPLNILVLVDEPGHAGALLRAFWPVQALVEAGVAKYAHHAWPGPKMTDAADPMFDETLKRARENTLSFSKDFIRDLAGADVILMPQTACSMWHAYIRFWQGKGKVVVLDADDDSFKVHPLSPSYAVRGTEECAVTVNGKPLLLWEDYEKHLGEDPDELARRDPKVSMLYLRRNRQMMDLYANALREADAVTTTTERARKRFLEFNANTFVLPNCVDTNLYVPGRHPGRPGFRIGWYGGNSHENDVRHMALGLKRFLARRKDALLVVAGALPGAVVANVPGERVEFWDWSCMEAHPWRLMGLALDLGLCAVEPGTPFNACKSPLKWTELGACGVPAICTNAPPYSDAVRHNEDGFLVNDTPEAWEAAIESMYEEPRMRARIGDAARRRTEKDFDTYRKAGDWYDLYSSLVDARRSTVLGVPTEIERV